MNVKEINGKKTRMLEPVFWKAGSLYVRVDEGESHYVYEVVSTPKPSVLPTLDEYDMPKSGDSGNFEVFAKRIVPKISFDKNESYEMVEKYPSNEEWGSYAWTYTQWDNVVRAVRKKFFGQPFYNENDREFIREFMEDISTFN